MNLKKSVKALALAGLAAAVTVTSFTASAGPRVKWKMQSAFGSTLAHIGPAGLLFAKHVERMSEGKFQIKFFEPGALVPALECFDAVSKGSIESCYTTPGYHAGKIPAVQFFTTVPFGPQIGEFLAWKMHAGGNALRDEIYAEHDLIAKDSLCIGPETSGWFKKPIKSITELKGLKMRFFGLGAPVMQKMGVSTQLLAGADIYPALERGVIDATEFSMPTIDINLGFYQIAKHNYYPGWHQQVSCNEFLMHRPTWAKLPDAYQAMIENSSGRQIAHTYSETEAKNPEAMGTMMSKYGVTNHRWPDDILAKFEAAWFEVLKEKSAADPLFKRVADHYLAFRKLYKPWADAQSLKATYLE
jgi:TRAP-type mannitol/chloroaromatic compound transport system substrate-binding protein